MSLDTRSAPTVQPIDPHAAAITMHGDVDSFPSHGELVRTLLAAGRFATLTTLTAAGHAGPGFPYGSLVAYSVMDDGSPLLCISELAEHTRNAHADSRAGMLVTGLPVDAGSDPLDRPRASIVGALEAIEPADTDRRRHLALHPGVEGYVDFPDFGWWRLRIAAARYVGGFGHMSWVTGDEIAASSADPVLIGAQMAIDHMNADHVDALLDMAHRLAGIERATAARVHAIDRHGMTLYVDVPGEPLATARIAFADAPLGSADDVRPAVVALARAAQAVADQSAQ